MDATGSVNDDCIMSVDIEYADDVNDVWVGVIVDDTDIVVERITVVVVAAVVDKDDDGVDSTVDDASTAFKVMEPLMTGSDVKLIDCLMCLSTKVAYSAEVSATAL